MTKLSWLGVFLSLMLLVAPAAAQDADAASLEWQGTITGQIEAFRTHDAPAALSFAAQSFKDGFTDPETFFMAIISYGYAPIMDSRSHSFGPYQLVQPDMVLQSVTFVGTDQALYEAVYQLDREAEGWRVGGVELVKAKGMGV